jgi:hypothetical protein
VVKPPWWTPVAPASARRRCSGAAHDHELRWERGELVLTDHDDATAEETLGALGGATPACVRVARAWRAHRDDPVLITLGRRAGETGLGLGDPPPPGARTADVEEPTRRDRLLLLFTLPAPLIDRLVLGSADAAARRWPDADFRARHGLRLGAALAARATPALRRLGGELAGPDESLVVHATPAGPGDRTSIRAERTDAGLEVTASMELDWVSTVWGPGISEPAGRMVVAVRDADGPHRVHVDVAEWHRDGVDHWDAVRVPAVLHRAGTDAPWAVEVS